MPQAGLSSIWLGFNKDESPADYSLFTLSFTQSFYISDALAKKH